MRKLLIVLLVVPFLAACPSKPKQTDTDGVVTGADEKDGPGQALNFNPQGSDSGQIDGLHTINFELDKSIITASAKELLQQNAGWIKNNPKATIQIEGHCDERGSVEYNFALGERRAKATKDYLVGLGVEAGRLNVISYGKEKPIDKRDTEEAFVKNRRANFVPLQN